VVQELALKADAVRAHSRGECEPELGTPEPARHKPELEEGLSEARSREALPPLADRLNVVQAAANARNEVESLVRCLHHLVPSEREPRPGKLASHEGEVPPVRLARGFDVDLVDGMVWGYDPNPDGPDADALFPQHMTIVEWFGRWVAGTLWQTWLVEDPVTGRWRGATEDEYRDAMTDV